MASLRHGTRAIAFPPVRPDPQALLAGSAGESCAGGVSAGRANQSGRPGLESVGRAFRRVRLEAPDFRPLA